jgi:hypothetical protein
MCKILPTYWSVLAQMVSCPHGFGTTRTSTLPERGAELLDDA